MDEQPEDEQQLEPDIEDSLIDANLDLPPAPATEAELEADTSEVPPASVRMGEVIGIQE
jgi:hypothetical protein